MNATRLAFGLWLLLTATQLFAEPVTFTFRELTTRPINGEVSKILMGDPFSMISSTDAGFYCNSPSVLTINPTIATFAFDNLSLKSIAIPEPAALLLLGTGLAALAALTKKRKNK